MCCLCESAVLMCSPAVREITDGTLQTVFFFCSYEVPPLALPGASGAACGAGAMAEPRRLSLLTTAPLQIRLL